MNQNEKKINLNILFYMESCKTCNVFINLAQKSNILKHFKMICIDGQKDKFKTQGLKKVPTIIIPSINKQFEGNECLKWLEDIINSKKNNILMDELYIPEVGLVSNQHNNKNVSNKFNNNINNQMSELTNQLNELSSKLNNDKLINKNNTVKRNIVPVQPPNLLVNQKENNQKENNQKNNNLNQPTVKPVNQLFGFLQNEMIGFSDSYAYISVDNPLPKSFLPPDKDMEIYTAPEGDKIDKKKQDQMIKYAELEREEDKNKFSKNISEINNLIKTGNHNLIPKWLDSNSVM